MKSFQISFQPLGLKNNCRQDQTLLDCAHELGIDLVSLCGGTGSCGKCKIQIISGSVKGSPDDSLTNVELEKGFCLACRTYPESELVVYIPAESLSAPQRLQVEGLEIEASIDPHIKSYDVSLPIPSLSDLSGDDDRLFDRLKKEHGAICRKVDDELSKSLSSLIRSMNWEASIIVSGDEVISLAPKGSPLVGMAVDLGTTKVAGYLVDLDSGSIMSSKGLMNPQIPYGEDIMTRMSRAKGSDEDASLLQKITVEALNQLAADLCSDIEGVRKEDIHEIVLVANTAMHHLLLALPVEQLALAPHVPAVSHALDIKARDLGLSISRGAYVHLLPNIAGFVGGDHLAMLLAINAQKTDGPMLAIDIGTNTEISLGVNGELTSVSCASGPAFEGAHISCGMRAAAGAIDHVRISEQGIDYHTIHGSMPIGICGSGVFDIVAQLHIKGIIDGSGRIREGDSRVRLDEQTREFVIVSENERGGGPAITVTQKDVREIQLAKAAINAGIQILLNEKGVSETDIERIFIAGAFGSYLDISSAMAIRMLPDIPLDRFIQVGNAAGTGAVTVLLSRSARNEVKQMAREIRYMELAGDPDFNDIFVKAIPLG